MELKFKKRLEKWNKMLIDMHAIMKELQDEFNQVYAYVHEIENPLYFLAAIPVRSDN